MPQLNPHPWLLIMSLAWATLLLFAPFKILTHAYPLQPLLNNVKKLSNTSWYWLWQ